MTRRFTLLISCVLATACGDGNDVDVQMSGGAGGTGTSGDEASDDLDGVRLDAGVGSSTGDAESGGQAEGHSGGVGSEEEDDGASDDESGAEVEDTTACLPTRVFVAIDEHMRELGRSAELMTNQPSANQPTGFLLAPGLPLPPATIIRYANVPDLPCDGSLMYPPMCDGGHCYQVECTGEGNAWMTLLWNQGPVQNDSFEFQQMYVLTSWNDVEPGLEFAIATDSIAPDGSDLSMLARGRMIDQGFYVVEQFPNLHEYGEVSLAYVWENEVYGGSMKIAGFTVAEVQQDGSLQPTGVCPEPET